ncbi:hypothetical protein B0H14DRAFT_2575876 [Mycena olivaceomarginata]|nr:hypothetical protein B0H14DRAFT_2575876 [Mycena olivaceomarginata]
MSLREGENGERRRTQGGMLRRVKLAKAQGLPKARGKKQGSKMESGRDRRSISTEKRGDANHGSFRAESNSHGETKDDIARVLTEMVRERWIEIGSHREKESRWGSSECEQQIQRTCMMMGTERGTPQNGKSARRRPVTSRDMAEHDAHVTDEEAKTTAEYLGRNLQEDRMKQFMWKVGD